MPVMNRINDNAATIAALFFSLLAPRFISDRRDMMVRP